MKKIMTGLLVFCLGMGTSWASFEASGVSKISRVLSYSDFREGDVAFELNTSPSLAACDGYYITPSSPSFHAQLSLIMMAYKENLNVYIHAYSDIAKKWPGSNSHFCPLYLIEFK